MESMGAVVTGAPEVAACTICPSPMYVPTWLTGVLARRLLFVKSLETRSPIGDW